jgi:hypothetical protein
MDQPGHIELWHDLYVMFGTSSAALLGLLYVVTSLHLDEIINNLVYRVRARSNSIFLIITLAEAVAVLTPQPIWLLGLELIALNLLGWWFPIMNSYRFLYRERDLSRRGGMIVLRALAFHACFLLGLAGAVAVATGAAWGLNLISVSYMSVLAAVAMNGWSIMLGVGMSEASAKPDSKR